MANVCMNCKEARFFSLHAGASWDPAKETRAQGIARNALELADAEAKGREAGLRFQWREDPDVDSSDFDDSLEPWTLWECICLNEAGQVLDSLGGVDFGRNGKPDGHPYARVVEAEMAREVLRHRM